jgi:hypothetical protein
LGAPARCPKFFSFTLDVQSQLSIPGATLAVSAEGHPLTKRTKNPENRFDETAPLVNLMTRQTRDSSNQESVLVHLGLQIGLNFVPATKTKTAFAETTARQAVIFAGPRD